MTRPTALALIRRMDINRELIHAGRPLTRVDQKATDELWDCALVEDVLAGDRGLADVTAQYGGRR